MEELKRLEVEAGQTDPHQYYDLMRHSKDRKFLRLQMVSHARNHGIKAATRAFGSTPRTVRKWLGRFTGKADDLEEHSRAPVHRPRKIPAEMEAKILRRKNSSPVQRQTADAGGRFL